MTSTLNQAILAARGPKNLVDFNRPYAWLLEEECDRSGRIQTVATLFLTNRECPFKCLMCDLWKNTTDESVPAGAIPTQIDCGLEKLGIRPTQRDVRQIKLYNSGNFFDARAVRPADLPSIADRINHYGFSRVTVENHPKLCNEAVPEFASRLEGQLEVAMGLETVNPTVLPRLNKQMTLDDFSSGCERLLSWEIELRAFILLRPPFLSEAEGIEWAQRSVEFAWENGVSCCAVIPTRTGNGMMENLRMEGEFDVPKLESLEEVMRWGMPRLKDGRRLLVDLWDAKRFASCDHCFQARFDRLQQMNLRQHDLPEIHCRECMADTDESSY